MSSIQETQESPNVENGNEEKETSSEKVKNGGLSLRNTSEGITSPRKQMEIPQSPKNSVSTSNSTPNFALHKSFSTSNLMEIPRDGKKKYNTDYLLSFQNLPECKDKPDGLSQMPLDIIKDNAAQSRTSQNGGLKNSSGNVPKSPKGSQQQPFSNKGSGRGKPERGGHKRQVSGGGRGGHKREPSFSKTPQKDEGPVAPLVQSENRWTRPTTQDEMEIILRKAQGILNKLTLERFDALTEKLNLCIHNLEILRGVINLIFDKALSEPHFSSMYAQLCLALAEKCPSFKDAEGIDHTFRRNLLNKCQQEFQAPAALAGEENMDPAEKEILEFKAKKRALGNIRFIGELFKFGMLPEKIMHECIKSLLKDAENPKEEVIECLAKLITTIGKLIDVKSADKMDEYFGKLELISVNKEISSRMRFMALDVIDLRANNWIPRRKQNEAKTLAEARKEAKEEQQQNSAPSSPAVQKSILRRSDSREQPSPVNQDARLEMGRGKKSPLSRSYSDNSLVEAELKGRGKSVYQEKKNPLGNSQEGWETVGKAPAKRGGFGRGIMSPSQERYAPKKEVYAPKEQPKSPVKVNAFSALNEESTGPKSALRDSSKGSSPPQTRKEVTIKEPEDDETEEDSAENKDLILANKVEMLLEEFLSSAEIEEATSCLEELKAPHFYPEVVNKAISLTFEKRDRDREEIIRLFRHWLTNGTLKAEDFTKGFSLLLESVEDLDLDMPFASKYVAFYLGNIVAEENSVPLSYLGESLDHLVESGKASQIVVGVLKTLTSLKGEETATEMCRNSKLDFLKFLPTEKRNLDDLKKLLEEKQLSFLLETKQ